MDCATHCSLRILYKVNVDMVIQMGSSTEVKMCLHYTKEGRGFSSKIVSFDYHEYMLSNVHDILI